MIRKKLLLRRLINSLLVLTLVSSPEIFAQQNEPNSDLYELDMFTINVEDNTGYQATKTLSGIGVATDMRDMSTVTSIVTREFLDDNLVGDFNTAMDYSTSVRQTSRSQITARRSFFTIRGFETSQILVNGVRANEDIPDILIQQIEVVKGPNALYGESDPGGLINVITKQPLGEDRLTLTEKVGSFGYLKSEFDANVSGNSGRIGLRILGNYEEFGGWRKTPGKYDGTAFGAIGNFWLTERIKLVFTGARQERQGVQSVRGAFSFNEMFPEDLNKDGDFDDTVEGISESKIRRNSSFLPRNYTGGVPDSFYDRSFDFLQMGARFLGDNITVQYLYTHSNQEHTGYGRVFNTFLRNGVADGFFQYDNSVGTSNVHSVNAFLEQETGTINHRFVLGGRFSKDSLDSEVRRLRPANGGENNIIKGWEAAHPGVFLRRTLSVDEVARAESIPESQAEAENIDYWNDQLIPVEFIIGNGGTPGTNGLETSDVFTAFLSDLMTFDDERAHVMWGIRHTDTENIAASGGGQSDEIFKGNKLTYQLGGVYDVHKDVGIYANYATSYVGNRNLDPATGSPYPAESGKAYEIGAKFNIKEGLLSGSLGYFDITKQNVVRTAFNPATGGTDIELTNDISKGIELELVFTPTTNWQTMISYTYLDAHADQHPPILPPLGLESAAPHTWSLWTSYEIEKGPLKRLRFGGGLVKVRGPVPQQSTSANRFIIEDGYTEVDLFARYVMDIYNTPVTFGINLDNATDEFYFRTRGNSNEKRRAVFSAKVDF
jgi:iron complex outermembrane recepter protein